MYKLKIKERSMIKLIIQKVQRKMKNKRNYLKEKGITLIALVVTIVVLLILAGVSLNAIFGDNGIIKRAQDAQNKMNQAVENDQKGINELSNWLDSKTNGSTGGDNNPSTTPKISTLVGTVVDKNTKAEDAYGNKITIPKGFKILPNGTEADSATYTYSGNNIPTVQDGIVIVNGTDGNQFVWVPVGEIKNKDNTTNIITLGRYSNFIAQNEIYTPAQSAENYTDEIEVGKNNKENYVIAKLNLQSEIKINRAIQLDGILDNEKVMPTAAEPIATIKCKELSTFRKGSASENATARDLKTFIETSLANGGYYIGRFEVSKTTEKIESKYNQTVLVSITQPDAATLAREMYGEVKENDDLIYASDLVNSYAWDTAITFIQTYSSNTNYASVNVSTSFAKTGINSDKYCNIWDMSGNASEWSTEVPVSTSGYVSRGGYLYYTNNGTGIRAGGTKNRTTNLPQDKVGLRALIYVK